MNNKKHIRDSEDENNNENNKLCSRDPNSNVKRISFYEIESGYLLKACSCHKFLTINDCIIYCTKVGLIDSVKSIRINSVHSSYIFLNKFLGLTKDPKTIKIKWGSCDNFEGWYFRF